MGKTKNCRIKSIIAAAFVLLALVVFLFNTRQAYADENTNVLLVSLVNQDPDPVSPGHYVDVRFKIENDGDNDMKDVVVKLMPEYPFSSDEANIEKRIGTVFARQNEDSGIVVKFKVRVDEKAIEGTSAITIAYKSKNTEWQKASFDINIRTVDSTVSIEKVEAFPEKISPGEKGIVNITLKNMADSAIRDITFKLDLGLSSLLSYISSSGNSLYYDLLPFAPLDSATEKKVKLLMPGQKKTISYRIIAYPTAEAGVYKIPVIITYYDELQEEHQKNDFISLIVSSRPELSVTMVKAGTSSEILRKSRKNKITLKFVNKGLSEIKFLNVAVVKSDYYTILSSDRMYIGNIDSDDYETADFEIYIKDNAPESMVFPVEIEYRDSNNMLHKEEVKIQANLYSEKEIREFESAQEGSKTKYIIAVIVVFAIIAVWLIRRRKRE